KSQDKSKSNFKLITTTTGVRVSQACDRCRIKKIKCDGQTPCLNCSKIGFECKTSDKLTRRAFPKGYTENLEKKLKELEEENDRLKERLASGGHDTNTTVPESKKPIPKPSTTTITNESSQIQINNPIDQIFNLDNKGIIIGNDNLNFESQFNHLLINFNLPFLKITNSHNFLINDPNSYLYHPTYTSYNQFHNKDLDVIYNPLTGNTNSEDWNNGTAGQLVKGKWGNDLPIDVYDLFISLINNFKKLFSSKKELDNQITQYFLNYNIFIPIFDYEKFMKSYDDFHTMYPFIFTYDDSTINGFNLSNTNDYQLVNDYLMTIIQIYAMIMMNDPTINLNLLLNHSNPSYIMKKTASTSTSVSSSAPSNFSITSLYDFLPYFNVFHVSINQLHTYQLFLYYSLLTNNKEKSLILSSLINSFIGILGINLNSKNLFFNDLSLSIQQKRDRVKIFWVFKVLLKCFNLKFGYKPSLNTTVINPVTIDRYFQLTPDKLSTLLDTEGGMNDELFQTLLKPSIEFLNLVNMIIPSSFSPNYYQYLKQGKKKHDAKDKEHARHLDWILNEDDGDGNDGNLNYNFHQFLTIDKNLCNWRESLKNKKIDLSPLTKMGLVNLADDTQNDLYHDLIDSNLTRKSVGSNDERNDSNSGITNEGYMYYLNSGKPDVLTASQLIKIQLNFHCIIIRSINYLNFIVDKELTYAYYIEITKISKEVLSYFLMIFLHLNKANEKLSEPRSSSNIVMESLGLDMDEDGFVINDFSVKRRRISNHGHGHGPHNPKRIIKEIPYSPFNSMLNGLSMSIINFKKAIVLQMIYLLICQLKFLKRNQFEYIGDSMEILSKSIDLFIKIFINYKTGLVNTNSKLNGRTHKEDDLYKKLINDQLQDEILRDQDESDDEDDEDAASAYYRKIDWDDEEMDEDLKYLKILKFIKYKS
ncbi:uncharacterized protein CANTADRAFT_39262, partial [Suhomyces tanzawaensis NRRL Y-17324]